MEFNFFRPGQVLARWLPVSGGWKSSSEGVVTFPPNCRAWFLFFCWLVEGTFCVFFLHPACRPSVSVLVDGKNGFTTRKKIGTHHLPTSQRGVLCIVFFASCHLSVECLSLCWRVATDVWEAFDAFLFSPKISTSRYQRPFWPRGVGRLWTQPKKESLRSPANPTRPSHQINKCTC